MKSFYRNKSIVVSRLLLGGFISIIAGVAFIRTGDPVSIVVGLLFLAPPIYLLYLGLRFPAVTIAENVITIKSIFGKTRLINDLTKYNLVVSIDYVAFRKEGDNDIMIDKGWHTGEQWKTIVSHLESLSFQEIIR